MSTLDPVLYQSQQRSSATPEISALINKLHERYGHHMLALFLYGSCRKTSEPEEGLIDLCVIVDDYRKAHGALFDSITNRLLAPNVYFLQAQGLRCKYIVISKAQFAKKLSSDWDHYFWARFSQPFTVLYTQTQALQEDLVKAQRLALMTFYQNLVPAHGLPEDPVAFWATGLQRTYACELRPEKPEHTERLINQEIIFWKSVTEALLLDTSPPKQRYWRVIGAWKIRRVTGKLLNLARLLKAASTFQDGVDYIAWKVERHSGVSIDIKPWMRRYPRIAGWWLAWQLKRKGGFR